MTPDTWSAVHGAARRLGIADLSALQRGVVQSLLEGRDALIVAPDSSAVHHAAPLAAQVARQPVLVVSPRAAALREQHERLNVRRVPSVCLDEARLDTTQTDAVVSLAAAGSLVVFATPGALVQERVLRALATVGLAGVLILESATATGCGPDLDVGMAALPRVLSRLGHPPLALHAPAAVPEVRRDLLARFGLETPALLEAPMVRRNLSLESIRTQGDARQRALISLVTRVRRPGIVFCPTPEDVDAVHNALGALRVPVHRYHQRLPLAERSAELLSFVMPGRRTVMVATSAFAPPIRGMTPEAACDFGLCLDKHDIRFVLHYHAPASLEQYAREIDLAGRDGEPATCVVLGDDQDAARWREELVRLRPSGNLVESVVRALQTSLGPSQTTSIEDIARQLGHESVVVERLVRWFERAGLVAIAEGGAGVRAAASRDDFATQAAALAGQLSALAQGDARRTQAVCDWTAGGVCRARALEAYFGSTGSEPCGTCSVCTGDRSALLGDDGCTPHRRRSALHPNGGELKIEPHVDGSPSEANVLSTKAGDSIRV